MEYKELAEKLGETLMGTSQYKALEKSKQELEEDVSAQVLKQSLDELTRELVAFKEEGKEYPEDKLKKYNLINERMAVNKSLQDYNKTQESFNSLISEVNDVIAKTTGVPTKSSCNCGCPHKRS